jgi:hypothetical protein
MHVLLFTLAGALPVCAQSSPRTPRGIYAVVAPAKEIKELRQNNSGSTTAQLYQDLANLYSALLSNPAVSGLTLQVHWDDLNPNPPGNTTTPDWTVVDLAFAAADNWNIQNPSGVPKTIQLIVDPGFQSPKWVLDPKRIPSCDPLFENATPPNDCGTVTFKGYSEPTDGNVLPLPWNSVYKSAWQTFLEALAAKYGSTTALVSIAVDGPSAASAEITTASDADTKTQKFSGGDISPNDMWLQLLAFHYTLPAYQGTDLAFIDEWDAAIDMYGTVFSGVTLVATMGEKLPDFNNDTYPIPTGFGSDCDPTMSCAAETTILSYFAEPTAGGATNAKATQTSSFTASHRNLSLGINSVKQLSLRTAQLPAPSAQILGGIQFDQSFVQYTVNEGCTMAFPPDPSEVPNPSLPLCTQQDAEQKTKAVPAACVPLACFAGGVYPPTLPTTTPFGQIPQEDLLPPEQALYNLLNIYFDGTPAASSFGGTPGSTPLNYLQVFAEDIVYATNHAQAPVPVIEKGQTSTVWVTAQSMLELASQLLFQIAEPGPNN